MAATPVTRGRGGAALALWTLLPALAAGVLVLIAIHLHERGCGGSLGDEPLGVAFQVATLGGILALVIGGARSIDKSGPLGDLGHRVQDAALVLLAVAAFVGAILVVHGYGTLATVILIAVATSFFYGLALVAAAFLGLVVLTLSGRDAGETGVLLPVYLFGGAFLVYLPILLLGAIRVGGCFE